MPTTTLPFHRCPSAPIRVTVPATTANLGPGFDSMGLALDLWNTFTLAAGPDAGVTVEIEGEGAEDLPRDNSHLTVHTMLQALEERGLGAPRAAILRCHNAIPCASGLGSSSSAVIAGLVFAEALARETEAGRPICPYEIDLAAVLSRAVALEGHGDNVTPAVLGGLQVVYTHGAEYRNRAIPIPPTRVVVCVPRFKYLTVEARADLPPTVAHHDAVFNIGRAMLVIEAMRGQDDSLLADAMQDRLHERYRVPRIPGAEAARAAALERGALAVALSGAGPGLIAFARSAHDAIGESMVSAFAGAGVSARYWVLSASGGGTRIEIC